MGIGVGVSEDVVHLLDKYCLTRPSTVSVLIDRIAKEWYTTAPRAWKKNPNLIPQLKHIPEDKITTVNINKDHAKNFLRTCFEFNLNPVDLLTWLAEMFIKAYNIKYRVELNKKRNMKEW